MRARIAILAALLLTVLGVGAATASTAQAGNCPKGVCSWIKPHAKGVTSWKKRDHPELDVRKTKCVDLGDSAGACLDVYYHDARGGITVNHVYLRLTGGFWESKAADCDNVRLWNQNDTVKWRRDDAQCDIYKNAGTSPSPHDALQDLYAPSLEMDSATSVTVGWTFSPKLDLEPDPGSTHLSVTVS